ncbi:MAG: FAD:protein FMN transferase [bacterium]|jgi:thiamine biosynthesis lipoprotein
MRKYTYAVPVIIIAIVLVITLTRQRAETVREYSDSRMMMDTFVEICIWGEGKVSGEACLDSAFAVIASIDTLFGDGLITWAERGVLASPEAQEVMAVGREAWDITGGLFDPTIGSVSSLWEFYAGARPPEPDCISAALAYVGLDRYPAPGRPYAGDPSGFILDIGGVAKGYALDLAAAEIGRLGFDAAIVNAGGDIKILGEKPGGGPWRIAIRHPRERGEFLGCLEVGPVSVATSGDYERSFACAGKRYHHILDPRDGMPSGHSVSVTVVGPDACLCDALATGLFVLGPERGVALAESLQGVEAVFVYGEGLDVVTTGGIADSFERLE